MTADSRASGAGPAPDDRLARAVLAASQDCVKTLSLDGSLLSINAAGCGALEIDEPAAVVGGSWVDFWRGPDREAAQKALEAAAAGSVGQFQGCCPTTSGVVKWRDVIVNAAADETGAPAFLLAVSRDITRQKQDESLAAGQRRALELLARGALLAETLTVLAETIEANARAASVSILVRENGCLRQGASPRCPTTTSKPSTG